MLTRFSFACRYSASHPLRLQRLRVSCFFSLMVSVVIFSSACLGQTPEPIPSPATELQSAEPQSAGPKRADQIPAVNENVAGHNALPSPGKAKFSSERASVEPLTRQAAESSTEIAPADRRIMSDIQEIRAMLGGGLEREFEEINQVLRQHPASMVSPASPAATSQENHQAGGGGAQEDRGATESDWFSRELGQMVRARSQLLPPPDQVDSAQQQQGKSHQPFPRHADRRDALLSDDPRSALRQCARELELVAGTLEQIEAYENADTVRREATQLWEKARNK